MTLGEKLQQLRIHSNLSQEELAARLQVSRQAISKWELDKTVPDVKYIVELSELFSVSTDELLKDGPMSSPILKAAAAPQQNTVPLSQNQDNSLLLGLLLLCGDLFLMALMLFRFFTLQILSFQFTLIPLLLVLFLAPVFLLFSRYYLRFPARSLSLFRHASAACLSLWCCALMLILDHRVVIPRWQTLQTGGALGFLIPLGLIAALYFICFRLVCRYTRSHA